MKKKNLEKSTQALKIFQLGILNSFYFQETKKFPENVFSLLHYLKRIKKKTFVGSTFFSWVGKTKQERVIVKLFYYEFCLYIFFHFFEHT